MSGVLIGINLGRSGQFWTDAMVKRFKHFFFKCAELHCHSGLFGIKVGWC